MTTRTGGDVVVETLESLGARAVVGLPGQHALALFDALRRGGLKLLSSRVENNAGFMADGIARTVRDVAPLLVSTGPGALTSLAALQEAAGSSVPVLAISAQVPTAGLGGGRHGYLHELPDQSASFRGVVKAVWTVRTISQIAPAIREAWATSISAPAGPVLVEIPEDLLLSEVGDLVPPVALLRMRPSHPTLADELVEAAAELLAASSNPVILAGGGVVRSGAEKQLQDLAELLAAPVLSTFGGKTAFPWQHPLSARSWLEDIAVTEFMEQADVLLVIGSGLGELTSNYRTLQPSGRIIQIDADLGKLASNHPAIGIHADARDALSAVAARLRTRQLTHSRTVASVSADIEELLAIVEQRLDSQALGRERQLIDSLRRAIPDDVNTFWDMTILGYWAWSAWDPRSAIFASAQGAGGLGYGFPSAIGSAFGNRTIGDDRPVLAVSGDGGALYGIAELATLAQHQLNVTWLIIDDGGYGILREYMVDRFGTSTATELARPDYVRLAESFGITAESVTTGTVEGAVARALSEPGPHVIVLPSVLQMFKATHTDRAKNPETVKE